MEKVDFSLLTPGMTSAPFIQDALTAWSYDGSGVLQAKYVIVSQDSVIGYRCPEKTRVLLPTDANKVQLAVFAPDRVRIQGLDINMDASGNPATVSASANVQLVTLTVNGLRAVELECNTEAILVWIEWEPAPKKQRRNR